MSKEALGSLSGYIPPYMPPYYPFVGTPYASLPPYYRVPQGMYGCVRGVLHGYASQGV